MTSQLQAFEKKGRAFLANVATSSEHLFPSRGYAQVLYDGLITQENERSEYQRIDHEESVRIARIVDDLKDLAQIEEGQMAMNLTPRDLRRPIEQAAATVRPVAGDKGIDLSVNLLDSSLRQTPRNHLPLVFQRFHQGHGQGRGLGLAIVRSIVQAHGGEVGVTSAIGTGTTLWFRVPSAPLTA